MSDESQILQSGVKFHPTYQSPLSIDQYIDCETALIQYVNDLKNRKINTVALDLEGDQGTIRYNYSVSIFQCFDRNMVVIIDVLKMGNNATLRSFLTDPTITKIMFSCANDIFISQNVLQCTISPVRDIAVGQKLLNDPVNLSEYIKIDPKIKDSFQRANWLKRPIAKALLEYAINDVVNLFSIEDAIIRRLNEVKLFEEYCIGSMKFVEKNYIIDQMHHYKVKFPGYIRLSSTRRQAAATVWIFRELVGQHFDCPVGYILSKKAMAAIIRSPERILISLECELNRNRSKYKKIKIEMVESFFQKAIDVLENYGNKESSVLKNCLP